MVNIVLHPKIFSEKLIGKITGYVDKSLRERESLGLSVPEQGDLEVSMHFDLDQEHSYAYACQKGGINVISLEPSEIGGSLIKEKNLLDKLRGCLKYLAKVGMEGDEVLQFLENPSEFKRRLQKDGDNKNRPDLLQAVELNINLIEFYITNTFPEMREALEEVCFLDTMRHEMDHIDFFSTPIHQTYKFTKMEADKMRGILEGRKEVNPGEAEDFIEAEIEALRWDSDAGLICEIRALFFSIVPQYMWASTDFDEVKEKVVRMYWGSYMMEGGFQNRNSRRTIKTVSKYASLAWPRNVEKQMDAIGRCEDAYNFRAGKKPLIVADIIGNAYRNNPSLLREANNATHLEDFLCRLDK